MHAKDAVGLLLYKELDLTLGVEVRLGARVGGEGELPDFILDAVRLELLLRLADPSHLGMRVHDGGNGVVVDVTVTVLDVFDGGNSCDNLFRSLSVETWNSN